ncbi:hypothetical protein H6P81_013740 [Aristolochia fimbriata]|uniref:Uncharacterized protein n=1 Tax=Aristolochia fimbriata TaxID=158543 RepID=A0AAV7EJ55_ARIFI|nr:hypothetical protein H6P81_013740 [Aristolochia fimbriata]
MRRNDSFEVPSTILSIFLINETGTKTGEPDDVVGIPASPVTNIIWILSPNISSVARNAGPGLFRLRRSSYVAAEAVDAVIPLLAPVVAAAAVPLVVGQVDAFPPAASRRELALHAAAAAVVVVRLQVHALVPATGASLRPGAEADIRVLMARNRSRVVLGKEAAASEGGAPHLGLLGDARRDKSPGYCHDEESHELLHWRSCTAKEKERRDRGA